jgi:hypothetical protein
MTSPLQRILTAAEIAQVASSNALVDTAALQVRFNFSGPADGVTLTWPGGVLQTHGRSGLGSCLDGRSNVASPVIPDTRRLEPVLPRAAISLSRSRGSQRFDLTKQFETRSNARFRGCCGRRSSVRRCECEDAHGFSAWLQNPLGIPAVACQLPRVLDLIVRFQGMVNLR